MLIRPQLLQATKRCTQCKMKKYLYILLLLLIASCDLRNAESYAIEAEKLSDNGNYLEANELLDKALKKDPYFIGAYINKGANLAALKKFEDAIKIYNQALSIDSENTMILYNLANNYKQIEKYNKAILFYNKALNTKGGENIYFDYNNENSYIDLGNNYDIEGSAIFFQRGITYLCLDSIKSSISDFKRCVNNNYNLPKCYYYLGINYYKIHQDSLGCEYLKKSAFWKDEDAIEALNEYCK